jgi:hypothetical protein
MMSDTETNTQNGDGSGNRGDKDKGGNFIISVAGALAAAALTAIGSKLFGERSVILIVSNQTPQTLKKIADHHESGGFAVIPKLEIGPSSSDTFGSQNTDPAQGAIGSVTYAGDGISLLVGWGNPRIGDNKSNHTLDGPNKSRYLVVRQTGSGDTKAEMLYAIGVHPDYHVSASLAARGQSHLSGGIQAAALALGKSARPISVRDLVDF